MRLIDLISDDRVGLSLGKVAFWPVFTVAMIFWCGGKEIPSTMFNTLMVIMGYNLGKKAIWALQAVRGGPVTGPIDTGGN